ncbi:hypothetical protein QF011_000037 [Curtobacterium flaccumfaciens]|nr:hypothetical protein [Curtobacterium flaccumfaciens]MDQ0537507.1 hypothetical protein [Curtobacterium flaccumfaciens]
MSWMQGAQATRSRQRVAFVQSAGLAEAVATSPFGRGFDVVFASDAEDHDTDGAPIVGFSGELVEDGEVRLDDDLIIQFQNYAVAEFLSFPGPTVLVPQTDRDLEAFAAHLTTARASGVFPDVLTDPQVVIGDRHAWVGGAAPAEPEFVFVAEDGTVSSSPWGTRFGRFVDGELTRQTDAVQRSGPDGALHFLQAVEALRYATARGLGGLSVSGYGAFLDSDTSTASKHPELAPGLVLLFGPEQQLLHVSARHKTYSLTRDLASLVELQLRFGDRALEHADESNTLRGLSGPERDLAVSQVRSFLESLLQAHDAERVDA